MNSLCGCGDLNFLLFYAHIFQGNYFTALHYASGARDSMGAGFARTLAPSVFAVAGVAGVAEDVAEDVAKVGTNCFVRLPVCTLKYSVLWCGLSCYSDCFLCQCRWTCE
jgi:hypothetical protein